MPRLVPTRKGDFRLERRMAVIVPSTKFEKPVSDATFKKRIKQTRDKLHRTFGGSTRERAIGTFTSEKIKLGLTIEEKVVKVEAFAKKGDWRKERLEMVRWLRRKAKKWGQESLAFEFEDDLILIDGI